MSNKNLLHVGIANLPSIQVAHTLCIFPSSLNKPFKKINETFQSLREWVANFGLDPNTLLHIGIPSLDGKVLVTYSCCLEFPLPIDEGGLYVILRIEKKSSKILKAIRQFHGDYIPENRIVVDENRQIYEIYYTDTMEYCVPVIG